MRLLLALLPMMALLGAEMDLREMVRHSVEVDEKNWEAIFPYSYTERVEKYDLDKYGEPKKHDVKTFDLLFVEGSHYRRLISRFDKPLSPEETESEEWKYNEMLRSRERETASERAKRIESAKKKRDENRKAIQEIPEAFNFKLTGEETVRGRDTWVLEATPREGYHPRNLRARTLSQMEGKLWIDKKTGAWVRLEGELMEGVSFGWFLVRLHQGARATVEATPLDNGLWAPELLKYRVSMRIGLIKLVAVEQESRFTGYRKQGEESGDSQKR